MDLPTISTPTSRLLAAWFLALALLLGGCSENDDILTPTAPSSSLSGPGAAVSPDRSPTLSIQYQVLPFDVPASLGDFTSAFGINDFGVITGSYAAPDFSAHGFLFKNGAFVDDVVPGAGPSAFGGLGDVNNLGTAVGSFSDASDLFHMYLRDRTGKHTILPDALPGALSTDATGINDFGWTSGTVTDADGHDHGFIYRRGVFTIYDHPGAVRTRLFGINNRGQVAGFWVDALGVRRGFVLAGGTVTPIEVPGAIGTGAVAINDWGQVVGFYADAGHVTHGFVLTLGKFTTIDFPGSTDTRMTAINNLGVITGTYDFFSRGMVAIPAGLTSAQAPAGLEAGRELRARARVRSEQASPANRPKRME